MLQPPASPAEAASAARESGPVQPRPAAPLWDGSSRQLDPRHVPCARLGGALFAALVFLGGGGGFAFLALATEASPVHRIWVACLALALFALVSLSAWFYPPLEFRRSSWRLSPFGLEIRRGVWFRHALSVPRARVQHTDVERGPLERRFDLATLVVHTAGHQNSEVRLQGLEHATALAIRDYLLAEKLEEEPAEPAADGA